MTDRVTDILSGLPAGSLEPQLRASIEMAAKRRRDVLREGIRNDIRTMYALSDTAAVRKDALAETVLCETVRRECAYALDPIGVAIVSPKISRAYLEGAIASLLRAQEAAAELDPPPERGEAA